MLCVLIRIASQYTIYNIKKKITVNYPKSAVMGLCSRGLKNEFGKRAIGVRATEVLLYIFCYISNFRTSKVWYVTEDIACLHMYVLEHFISTQLFKVIR